MMSKTHKILFLLFFGALFLGLSVLSFGQTMVINDSVSTFPSTITGVNTSPANGGQTATGMQGSCFTLPCCSVLVYKVTLPANGVLRVELTPYTPLAQSIIAYYSTVPNPTSFSDLAYVSSSPGNFCGFRDTLQLGRAYGRWDNTPYGGVPYRDNRYNDVYDLNNPGFQKGFFPAGDYYLMIFTENQQSMQGIGSAVDLTFEFIEACEPLTVPSDLTFDTLEFNAQQDTLSFYVKNDRQLDVVIDTSNLLISGADAADFSILNYPDTNLSTGDSTSMSIVFSPTSGGVKSASIDISFADSSCSATSTALLSGYGAIPEIVVLGNNNNILNNDLSPTNNDLTNMGVLITNTGTLTQTYQITNTGSDTLEFTNNPIVSLSGDNQFTVTNQPANTVLPGDTTSFSIAFTPTVDGTASTDVSIANNDPDESTFLFRVEATGAERNGLHFDGSNDYVVIDDVADDMTGITSWTVESWIKADPTQSGNDHIVAVNTSGTGNPMLFRLGDGVLNLWDGSNSYEAGPDLRDDQWHHVAVSYDNGQVSLYIDGINQGSFSVGSISFSSTNRWSLGQEYDGSSRSDYFKGALNEVRIWKTVKTAQQIADDKYCEVQSPATETDLVAYYTFNQGVAGGTNTGATAITDASGFGNTGTATNFDLTGSTSNFIAATNVGVNCNSVSVIVCDAASYSISGGNTYSTSGVYTDTLTNGMAGDSIVITDLSINFFQASQDIIADTTVCDTLIAEAQTNYTPFATFENTNGDWVEINGVVDSLVNTNRSVFLWMREADQVNSSTDVLVGINASGTSTVCNFGINTNEELWIYDGGNNRNSGVVVTDGLWHFVGYTYDEATNLTTFWVDGVEANSFSNGQSISATSRISLGQEFDGSSTGNFYDGDMAEVTIWNEVLDSVDIISIMESSVQPTHPKYAHLKAYYPMISDCGSSDFTLKDYGPHGYDGTMSANNIVITDSLASLPGHNAATLYTKSWMVAGSSIASTDTLMITGQVQAGNYTLNLGLDYFNVSDVWNVTVQPACLGLFASIAVDSTVSCNGNADGGATATGLNGVAPLSYLWSNGATTASITGIAAGTYTVTITDDNGDTSSDSISISEPLVLLANATTTNNASTNGASDGVATASPSGGTAPYSYSWSNGATAAMNTGLAAGTYTVTVVDDNGCTQVGSTSIIEPAIGAGPDIVITEISYNPPESGSDSTEFIELYNRGVNSVNLLGYSFTSGVVYTFPNINMNVGEYLVISVDSVAMMNRFGVSARQWTSGGLSNGGEPIALKDASGNLIDSLRYDDVSPWPVHPDGDGSTLVLCDPNADNADGTNWSRSSTTVNGVLINGKQVFASPTVQDDTCNVVTVPLSITVSVDSNVSCNGLSNGGATAMASGGNPLYTYMWSNSATTASITGVGAGTYTVTVTDNSSVTVVDTVVITEPSFSGSVEIITACGSYTWMQNGMTYNMSGMYKDTVMNSVGCDSIITLDLTINQTSSSTDVQSACGSYTWMQNGMTYNMSGMYNDTVMNSAGCDSIITLDLTINQTSSSTDVQSACGSYTWIQNGMTYNMSGMYNDTVMNSAGCDSIITLDLTINSGITANAGTDQSICEGSSVQIGSANSALLTYAWDNTSSLNNATVSDPVASPTVTTTYTVTVTETSSGCTATDQVVIVVNPLPIVDAGIDQTICNMQSVIIGGTPTGPAGATYQWDNAASLSDAAVANPAASPTVTTIYTVTVTNGNGCTDTDQVIVTVNPLPDADAGIAQSICTGETIQIGGQPTSTTVGVTFLWDNAATLSDAAVANPFASPVSTTTYTVTVTHPNGCTNVDQTSVTVNNASTSTENQTACASYTWPQNGQTYTLSGMYNDTILNSVGCDSIITLNLTIDTVNTAISQNGFVLTANQVGASYQWIDCSNGNAPIAGATSQSYTVTANGDYAVEVSLNSCTDTSTCLNVMGVGINSVAKTDFAINVFPNPTRGTIRIQSSNEKGISEVRVRSITGRLVSLFKENLGSDFVISLEVEKGVYLLEIINEEESIQTVRVIKQ